jgi:glc operon protein GlcG
MNTWRGVAGALALGAGIALSGSAGAQQTGVVMQPVITLDLAKKMAVGCEAKARQEHWLMNIAVVNADAKLIYFEHMDGAFIGSIYISQHKAMTSANFPFSTRRMAELAWGTNGKPGMVPGIADVPGIITFAGGLPIMAGKVHIGGIGVSGGTSDQDEQCAQAGLDAVKDELK